MNTETSRFTLRLPTELRDWLKQSSKTHHRSITAEMIEIIREKKEEAEAKVA